MTSDAADRINALPPMMRDRIMERLEEATGEQRTLLLDGVARTIESMPAEMREHMERTRGFLAQRSGKAPQVGDAAPDFDLALLDGDGARVRLSGLRGKPVGLIFGSYT